MKQRYGWNGLPLPSNTKPVFALPAIVISDLVDRIDYFIV